MPKRPRVRAVPWKTTTAERVKGALGELPAYVKRALRVQRAIDALFSTAERRYRDGLRFITIRQRELAAAKGRGIARAERALAGTVARFNGRWQRWVENPGRYIAVNAEIDGYNEWYAFERQCAVKYVPLDSIKKEQRARLGATDLLARFPLVTPVRLPDPDGEPQTDS